MISEKLNALTSLRFIAAILVVFYHTVPPTVFTNWPALANILRSGFTGVPLFFCLSGFILFVVYEDLTCAKSEISRFFIARLARIYPLYVFSLLLDLPRLLAARALEYGFSLGTLTTVVTLFAQMLMLQVWIPGLGGLNYPSWSVATEAAFYISFPCAVLFVRQLKKVHVIFFALCITWGVAVFFAALASTITASVGQDSIATLLDRNPIMNFPDFLAGILLGALWVRFRDAAVFIPLLPTAFTLAGVIGWFGIMAAGTSAWGSSKIMSAVLMPAFCILIFGLACRTGTLTRALSGRPQIFLGEISYAVYLLHAPIAYAFFDWLHVDFTTWTYTLYLIVVIGASAAAYLAIEVPMRRWINLFPARRRSWGHE